MNRLLPSLFTFAFCLLPFALFPQVSVNTDGSMPDNSAMLEVKASDKGFLPPRLTTAQRDAIANPAEGLNIYNIDNNMMEYYNGSAWRQYSYPSSLEVPCGSDFIDYRDNQVYPTVLIGTQCWMKKNLNAGTMINGGSIPANNSLIEKYCYNNNPANCAVYGGLYSWDEMMQYTNTPGTQGICPAGWHIPTDAEWCTLTTFLDASISCTVWGYSGTNAGGKLKETGTTHWASPNEGATNESGFSAPGAGYLNHLGSFSFLSSLTTFWSSSESSTLNGLYRSLGSNYANVYWDRCPKAYGFSGRCVRTN